MISPSYIHNITMDIFKPWKAQKFLLEKAVSTMFGPGSSRYIQSFHSQGEKN